MQGGDGDAVQAALAVPGAGLQASLRVRVSSHHVGLNLPRLARTHAVMAWLHACTWASFLLLWVATALALWSLANYMANVWHYFRYPGELSK